MSTHLIGSSNLATDIEDAVQFLRSQGYQVERFHVSQRSTEGIIFAQPYQLEKLRRHGYLTLADSTHKTNRYDWRLFTLYIRDGFGWSAFFRQQRGWGDRWHGIKDCAEVRASLEPKIYAGGSEQYRSKQHSGRISRTHRRRAGLRCHPLYRACYEDLDEENLSCEDPRADDP